MLVASRKVCNSYHNRQADQGNDGVEYQNGSAYVILITHPSSAIHKDSREHVWWCYKALRTGDAETHTLSQNDWQEVGNRVAHCGQAAGCSSAWRLGQTQEETNKKINAKPQIFKSNPGLKNLPRVNASSFESPRSFSTRRRMKLHSRSDKNRHDDFAALSGKSTRPK